MAHLFFTMIEDKISLALKELKKLKDELKDIRKDMKFDEKIDTEQYVDLKKAYKDLKAQVKDIEDKWMQDLLKEEQYMKLQEMKVKKEEEVAHMNKKLFELISELPPKFFQMNVETEEGPVRVQIQPEMRIYLNGREEKKRAA